MFSLKNKKKIVSELSLSPIIIWSFVEKLRYLCKYIHIEDIFKSCLLYFIPTKEQSCVSELAGDCVIKRYN